MGGTPIPRALSRADGDADDASLELVEVPAAVVCATCGLPECRCEQDRPSAFSGVVAIVPWERPGGTVLSRLWATAKLATLTPDSFFRALPPGGVLAPLAFGVLSELLAAVGLVMTVGGALIVVLPAVGPELAANVELRRLLVRGVLWAVPALSAGMVVLHAAHGLALDAAARREGSVQLGRGLRFGLYGCGWDLVTLPLGLVLLMLTDGLSTALRHSARGLTAPGSAAAAYLTHVHHLEPERAQRASRRAVTLVSVPTIAVVAVAFLIGLAWAAR